MANIVSIEKQYFENAKTFLLYRTGKEAALNYQQFVQAVNAHGYALLTAGSIIVSLINERSDTANRIEDFRAMMKDITRDPTKSECICSFMMTSSNVPKARITAFEACFKTETAKFTDLKRSMLSASGLFAFNPLVRAFPMDDRYIGNLKDVVANNVLLHCGILPDEHKKNYNFRFGLNNIPTIQQNEIECVWNNYYEGDIIYIGNLSPTTVEAIILRRVTAPVSNHIKESKEAAEDEEKIE